MGTLSYQLPFTEQKKGFERLNVATVVIGLVLHNQLDRSVDKETFSMMEISLISEFTVHNTFHMSFSYGYKHPKCHLSLCVFR